MYICVSIMYDECKAGGVVLTMCVYVECHQNISAFLVCICVSVQITIVPRILTHPHTARKNVIGTKVILKQSVC